jgi:Tfp pilus assembly protein PilP
LAVFTPKILIRLAAITLSLGAINYAEPGRAEGSTSVKKSFKAPPKKAKEPNSPNSPKATVGIDITRDLNVEDITEPPIDFQFVSYGKDDPFLPMMTINEDGSRKSLDSLQSGKRKSAKIKDLESPIVNPLQKHDLSKLKVVGIWQGSTGERKALVMAPKNRDAQGGAATEGIVVLKGTQMGNRFGVVVSIGPDRVNVREYVVLHDGKKHFKTTSKYLGDKEPKNKQEIQVLAAGEKEAKIVDKNAEESFDQVLEKDRKAKEEKEKREAEEAANPNKFKEAAEKELKAKAPGIEKLVEPKVDALEKVLELKKADNGGEG